MNKQFILGIGGLLLVAILFLFGKTVAPKKPILSNTNSNEFSINNNIAEAKKHFTLSQNTYLNKIEDSLKNTQDIAQKVKIYNSLATFWKDSTQHFEPYVYYMATASKLVNSEKNLTFAAQLILSNLRIEQNEAKINWKTDLTIDLFKRAIELNPDNDDLKIGLGSAYIFGKGRFGSPGETMKGIQELLTVVRKDSNNMKAQLVLGIGGIISGQYDKAISRLEKVVMVEPNNLEAVAFLADAYAATGNKKEAVRYYESSKKLYNNPTYSKEVDERIKQMTDNR